MSAHVAFRVDASPQIGIGHFMRCLTLADSLALTGARVQFISRHLPDHLKDMLRSRGFECAINLSGMSAEPAGGLVHAGWLGTAQLSDARDTVDALSGTTWDWVVVDHYALDAQWESAVRTVSRRVLAIDDVADRAHDCEILLDQNLYEDMETRYRGKLPAGSRALLGPQYALLRPDFRRQRSALPQRSGRLEQLLICFGGIDANNYTARAMAAVDADAARRITVHVVVGASHPSLRAIEAACDARGFSCHVQVERMADLMAAADLAFGASGSTSWERCCVGLPTICVATAHNQVAIARGLERAGAVALVGDTEPVTTADLAAVLRSLMHAPDRLKAMSVASALLVDGLGTDRVRDAMLDAA